MSKEQWLHRCRRAKRSYSVSEVRGGCQDEQPHVQEVVTARVQEGLEELFHIQGRERRR